MRTFTAVAVLAAFIEFAPTVLAQTAPAAPGAATMIMGTVEKVDAAKNEIIVKSVLGAVETLVATSDTKIMKEGKDIALADVNAGDKITAKKEAGELKHIIVIAAAPAVK